MVKRSGNKAKKQNVHSEFEPNKMGIAIAALAAVFLALFGVMTML